LLKDLNGPRFRIPKDLVLDLPEEWKKNKEVRTDVRFPKSFRKLDRSNKYHKSAFRYLKRERELSLSLIRQYGFGYCRLGDFYQRIVIPIYFEGELVGYQGRWLGEKKGSRGQKYKFNSGFQASEYLFNFDRAKMSRTAVIVEGVFDALKIPNMMVAIFTNKMSERQVELVVNNWKDVVILLDRNESELSYRIYKELMPKVRCRVARLQKSKDPGEASEEEIISAIKSAKEGVSILV